MCIFILKISIIIELVHIFILILYFHFIIFIGLSFFVIFNDEYLNLKSQLIHIINGFLLEFNRFKYEFLLLIQLFFQHKLVYLF